MDAVNDIRNMFDRAYLARDIAIGEAAYLEYKLEQIKKENEGLRHRLAMTLTSGVVRIHRPHPNAKVTASPAPQQGHKTFRLCVEIMLTIILIFLFVKVTF